MIMRAFFLQTILFSFLIFLQTSCALHCPLPEITQPSILQNPDGTTECRAKLADGKEIVITVSEDGNPSGKEITPPQKHRILPKQDTIAYYRQIASKLEKK